MKKNLIFKELAEIVHKNTFRATYGRRKGGFWDRRRWLKPLGVNDRLAEVI